MAQRLQVIDLEPGESYWVLRSGIEEKEWYVYRPVYTKFIRLSQHDQPYFETPFNPAIFPTSFFHYYKDLPTDRIR
jgi:hypothetical protein